MSKGAIGTWIIWVILILLFVGLFPKTCGKISNNPIEINYNCIGTKAPFINSNNYSWCYGVCIETSKEKAQNKTIETVKKTGADPLINDIISTLSKLVYPMIIIFIIIATIKYVNNLRKKKTEVIYKKI